MDLERATKMIKALPYMSKTIVDNTLYEKVLSYLTLVLSTHTSHINKLNNQCQIFHQIRKACIESDDQDYRVTTLCIRFMGQLIYYGKDDLFKELECDHSELLTMITKGITSSEAALRCACIEACRLFLACDHGQTWLLKNEETAYFIMLALLDQSSYVVAEACRLFSTLVEFNLTQLMQVMNPSNLIQNLLQPNGDPKQTLSALDFCWAIVNMKNDNAIEYIRSKQLLHPFIPLLCLSDRIIRSRVLEILSILFSYDKDPLQTLNLDTCNSNINKAYRVIFNMAKEMIKESKKLDDLMTAVTFLDTSFTLLTQNTNTDIHTTIDEAYSILYSLIDLCMYKQKNELKHVNEFIKTTRTRNQLTQLVLRTMNTLVQLYPSIMTQKSNYTDIFNVLEDEQLYSDPRVLKSILALLTNTLWYIKQAEQYQPILKRAIQSLVKMSDETSLDCKSLSLVLDTLNVLLGHDQIGVLVTEFGHRFAEALSLKFLDAEWDIRDASIHFVGQLFEMPFVKNKIQFALTYNLPLNVFQRIHDSEVYVRASAIEVLQMMMMCEEGWGYIQQHQISRNLAAKLPSLLYDTEAIVRRAALDAIICLVKNRSCQGMKMEIKDSNQQNSLNPVIIKKLVYDDDIDVRSRACKLIECLWLLYQHEKQEHDFFQHLQAGELLVEAAMDTNRIVRIEAVRIIESILATDDKPSNHSTKRKFDQVEHDDFDTSFLNVLRHLNLTQQKQTLDPEHLYQEAFDINADMMIQSIIPVNPDDDVNMLDCY
ncbi:armadillo-type protein [Cokeromyces recurvatus]|uniref:armadillo-type protein n=1 Tax=Cokeromyces recurvatus TaxID=90255 RepID=UPI002220DFC3|nr:armadillo-type protein [Cokeromyces recurvatus]KAI7908207.1 armadillo-type protein [Cokeromyces recurvatus]